MCVQCKTPWQKHLINYLVTSSSTTKCLMGGVGRWLMEHSCCHHQGWEIVNCCPWWILQLKHSASIPSRSKRIFSHYLCQLNYIYKWKFFLLNKNEEPGAEGKRNKRDNRLANRGEWNILILGMPLFSKACEALVIWISGSCLVDRFVSYFSVHQKSWLVTKVDDTTSHLHWSQ